MYGSNRIKIESDEVCLLTPSLKLYRQTAKLESETIYSPLSSALYLDTSIDSSSITWTQSNDPALDWESDEFIIHDGEFWKDTTTNKIYCCAVNDDGNGFQWIDVTGQRKAAFTVSSAGNTGLYDVTNSKWMFESLESDPSNMMFPQGRLLVGGDSLSSAIHSRVTNQNRDISLHIVAGGSGSTNRAGIYDNNDNTWIIGSENNKDVFIPHPLTVTGALTASSSLSVAGRLTAPKSIVHGTVTITPTAANTPKYETVSWAAMAGTPHVVASAVTSVPGTEVVAVSVSNITTTGCRIYVTRTNKTATVVHYIAVY